MITDRQYITEKFLAYCRINTHSFAESDEVPTSSGQVVLLKQIEQELDRLGLEQVSYDTEDAYVVGKLPANLPESDSETTPIGFVAHVDTADFPSQHVVPRVFPNYDGRDLVLNSEKNFILSPRQFPSLKKVIGQTVITASGDTLLGADDKAGIAGLLGMLRGLVQHPEYQHGDIWVAFGPDEEIGKGAARLKAARFPVEFAYTLDNGDPGDIAYETFNAAEATVTFKGTVVHPGEAYGLMVNAAMIANRFLDQLPKDEVPEKSREYDGFLLVTSVQGNVDHARVDLIIRDFDTAGFLQKKALLHNAVMKLNEELGEDRVSLKIRDQYHSPREALIKKPYVVNLVLEAYHQIGLKPRIVPFRGGTDGDFITEKGIPTPNLFNGGANFHGPYEYVTVENMMLLAKTLITIASVHAKNGKNRDQTPLHR